MEKPLEQALPLPLGAGLTMGEILGMGVAGRGAREAVSVCVSKEMKQLCVTGPACHKGVSGEG